MIGLAMGLGTGMVIGFMMSKIAKLEEAKREAFFPVILATGRIGHIGLLFSVVSGVLLTLPIWEVYKSVPLFHVKITLVIILGGIIGMISAKFRKALAAGESPMKNSIKVLSIVAQLLSLTIVLLAVLVFK